MLSTPDCTSCLLGKPMRGTEGDPEHADLCIFSAVEDFYYYQDFKPYETSDLEFAYAIREGKMVPGIVLSTRKNMIWATRLSALESHLAAMPVEKWWVAARSALGLDWHSPVILIKFPSWHRPYRLCVPSFVEGGDNPMWRCEIGPDNWNRTVNLETGEAGLPEAILCPCRVDEDCEYDVFEAESDAVMSSSSADYDLLLRKAVVAG